ncbi:EF-hand domain-containing protein [Allorhodopirellula heiligendammensis]|uniref:EF hand n=1 Tax=Allorhodopirellula heiligendammensis TaxID=2714739 RepID=A0A5C6BE97_9BACT|nr:EF-hand domain-containing protein [Allorhodopirellula heiligendammensis]TWU09801.1 EF hand [Allorhodopirellula heiligendammensis]
MKRLPLLTVFCMIALSLSDSPVNAQPPGGRLGQAGGRQGGPQSGGSAGRGQHMGGSETQPVPPLMRVFDTDGDGELSSEEIDAAANALRKLDKNRDGKLTAEELRPAGPRGQQGRQERGRAQTGQSQRGGRLGGAGRPGGGPAVGGPEVGGPLGGGRPGAGGDRDGDPAQADAAFASDILTFDENRDGALDRSELPEHMHKAFETADANNNGALDDAERLVLASQFRRNKLNPTGNAPVNAPTQGRR